MVTLLRGQFVVVFFVYLDGGGGGVDTKLRLGWGGYVECVCVCG